MVRVRRALPNASTPAWKLQDAKARFSEVVRLAQTEGPQRVTVRGRDAVVIISSAELDRLSPPAQRQPLLDFMESLELGGLDLSRAADTGRDADL